MTAARRLPRCAPGHVRTRNTRASCGGDRRSSSHHFAHIDHAAGVASVGLPLRATDVMIFGSPKGGTAVMQHQQAA
jgi:hypothetical protein